MRRPVGILRFLGTNCDRDVWQAVEALDLEPRWLWFEDQFQVTEYSGFVIPGGFSYGDYLRCGALAAKAPVIQSLKEAATKGYPILGICNGFQVLTETGLVPGALVRNASLKFIDKWVELKVANSTRWSSAKGPQRMRLPIAHGEGRYYVESDELKSLQDNQQIWLTYEGSNPNGSVQSIAGVANRQKNVCGLMPHPERAMAQWMGGADGQAIMAALLE